MKKNAILEKYSVEFVNLKSDFEVSVDWSVGRNWEDFVFDNIKCEKSFSFVCSGGFGLAHYTAFMKLL